MTAIFEDFLPIELPVVDTPCSEADPELWFAQVPADVEFAKALCRTCPIVEACLQGAIEREEPWGVWGGQLFERGSVVAFKRSRGRPRKDADRHGQSWQ